MQARLVHALSCMLDVLRSCQAEMARSLGLRCAPVAALVQGREELDPDTPARIEARRLQQAHPAQHDCCHGDSVAIYRWRRREPAPYRVLVGKQMLKAGSDCPRR